ncbi:CO/xanthine dehydrogenase Mo-binding subunit [Tumebacillus sp. BK434]|uniref:xanthine dehydrogenase family protein molybdopterin-binding subunit n=1 Tax=Tumebacillus sp. BK434 TaxID=2512169 RepID=UPI0010539198|nr:xanthine dehydrogenase family protein molybdopterin-binding subunit [Tumebacillus sp. BK434]TCP55737.1 CO/xanthine dehydrogenase Mo-binding subunit [Tumebacillus sp. BK434]
MEIVGKSIPRKESLAKVTGAAKYTDDLRRPKLLHAWLLTSPHAHARIVGIDTTDAAALDGVRAILTGDMYPQPLGEALSDRPYLAVEKVRYHGEPVAVAVAETKALAKRAAELVRVSYELLPVVNSPSEALRPNAPLLHERLHEYEHVESVHPIPRTNIGNHVKIRKGDMAAGWAESEVIVEGSYSFHTADHGAMEPRCVIVEAPPGGTVVIHASTQNPFTIKQQFNRFFQIDESDIVVHAPFVGGGFGGKGAIQLEYIAYHASRACGGRPVKLANSREQDLISSASHIGLEARVKLGATRDGKLTAAEYTLLYDTGGYTDQGAFVTIAGAINCTGPYRIDHVWCDALCVYTNHPYATSFRGFGHPEAHFCMERTVDLLARRLGIDPLELRRRNAIQPGDTTPTQAPLNSSNLGDLPACLDKLQRLIGWEEGQVRRLDEHRVLAKGMACVWKTSSAPLTSGSGAIVTFNHDGTANLSVGSVELGQGNRTVLTQILAQRLQMEMHRIHIKMDVDTAVSPEHWKTVGSTSTMMVGRAILAAADDAIAQLKQTASIPLQRRPDELEVAWERVFVRDDPAVFLYVKDVAQAYMFPSGSSIGGPVIGRGRYVSELLTHLDPETGKGVPGPQWTVGAQAVEVEFHMRDCTYRLLRAASVFDAGKVINWGTATGQIMGGMNMGLSWASRETFYFDEAGHVLNPQLRNFKIIRFGETPRYLVDFVETPYLDGPYGARALGEYGTIGMAPALANALSVAAGTELNRLPLTPERIWRQTRGLVP